MEGYIKIHRKIREWEWYKVPNTKIIFLEILLTVNIKDQKYRGQMITRGTILTTLDELASNTGLTKDEVRTAIKNLKTSRAITTRKVLNRMAITVCNFGEYQAVGSEKASLEQIVNASKSSHTNPTQTPTQNSDNNRDWKSDSEQLETISSHTVPTQSPTQVPHGSHTIPTHNKVEEEGKERKEMIVHFWESIWRLYPNKKGKGQVSDTQKRKLYKVGLDELSRCIDRYKRDKPDWQAFQNGSTFFNSGYVDYLDKNYSTESGDLPKNGDRREDGRVFLDGKWVQV